MFNVIVTLGILMLIAYEYIGLFRINLYVAYWDALMYVNENVKNKKFTSKEGSAVIIEMTRISKYFKYFYLTDLLYYLILVLMLFTKAWIIAIMFFCTTKLLSKLHEGKRHTPEFRKTLMIDKGCSVVMLAIALLLIWGF